MAKGKIPKKPEHSKILEICRKDFRNFKEDTGNKVIEYFQSEIKNTDQKDMPNSFLIEQRDRLEMIRDLIHDGRKDIAFSIFFRTFPSCLPHRTRNL